jgi:hypothetical protein
MSCPRPWSGPRPDAVTLIQPFQSRCPVAMVLHPGFGRPLIALNPRQPGVLTAVAAAVSHPTMSSPAAFRNTRHAAASACAMSGAHSGAVPWAAGVPRADEAVAAQDAPRHVPVGRRGLDGPQCPGSHAGDRVPVTDGVPGGLDPGNPGMPRPVPLVQLPAQQVPYHAPAQLHDRRARWLTSIQSSVPFDHGTRIRKPVQERLAADPYWALASEPRSWLGHAPLDWPPGRGQPFETAASKPVPHTHHR